MSAPTLVIMAAGMGSRYGGLKQIEPVGPNGEIGIAYSVHDALRAGFGKVVFVIRDDIADIFHERIGCIVEKEVEIAYAFQRLNDLPEGFSVPEGREKPWGTGHAILCCRDVVDGNFAAINADDFYGAQSYKVLADYLTVAQDGTDGYDYCMCGFDMGNTLSPHGPVARGVCETSDDGYLVEIVERLKIERRDGSINFLEGDNDWTAVPDGATASMNMWGFTPSYFDELQTRFVAFLKERGGEMKSEFLLPTIVGELVTEHKARVKVLPTDEVWFGVTYKDDLAGFKAGVAERIAQGQYPEKLWSD